MLLALSLAGLLQAVLIAAPCIEIRLFTDKPAMELAPHPDSNRHVISRVFDDAQTLTVGSKQLLQNAWTPDSLPPKHQRTACFIMACFLAAFCVALLAHPISAQDLDETVDEVRPPRHRLVWENVRSGSHHSRGQHLRGVPPNLGLALKRATVELAPGQSTEFLVPDGECVQVVSTDGVKLDDGQTRLWVSNGSGLYRRHTAAVSEDGLTLIAAPIAPGSGDGNWVARVTRSPTASCSVELALYTSARPELNLLDYYSCQIDLGKQATLTDAAGTRPRTYTRVPADLSARIRLPGASRLRIETRLPFDLQSDRQQTFWIRVYVDGQLHRVIPFDTEPVTTRRQFLDGNEVLMGRREFAYLDLDCGKQEIQLIASHACLLRVDRVGLELCRPELNRNFEVPSWQNVRKAISIWDVDAPPLRTLANTATNDPLWDPYLNQQRIQAIARDQSRPHGGLNAYLWTLACLSRRPMLLSYGDEISLSEMSDRIRRRYTRFEDTSIIHVPTNDLASSIGLQPGLQQNRVLREANFITRSTPDPYPSRRQSVIAAQHVGDALSAIGNATFVRLTNDPGSRARYRFPGDLGASLIRLVVDASQLSSSARLMIRFDDHPPVELFVTPLSRQPNGGHLSSGEIALSALGHLHSHHASTAKRTSNEWSVSGPFSIHREPLPLICAATAQWMKPTNAREMEVWVEDWPEDCETTHLDVGVQHLASRETLLSERSYRHLQSIADSTTCEQATARWAQQELDNDAWKLESELRHLHQQLRDSVRPAASIKPSTVLWDPARISTQRERINQLESRQYWAAAIELLSDAIAHSANDARTEFVLSRMDALENAGETHLAHMELRGWMIHSSDPMLRHAAFERLLKQAESPSERLRYLAFAAMQWKDPSIELSLANQLSELGRYRDALIILSTLESSPASEDMLLRCSLLAEWWQTFDQTLDRVSDPAKKNTWLGLKQWRLGFDQHAKKTLAAGDSVGQAWLARGKQAQSISSQLASAEQSQRLAAMDRWQTYQTSRFDHTDWTSMPQGIENAAGWTHLLSKVTHRRSSYAIAVPQRAAEVSIVGPAEIRLRVRLLHPTSSGDQSIREWLHLESNGASRLVPISGSVPIEALHLDDRASVVGSANDIVLRLGSGTHRFGVRLEQHECLLQLAVKRPQLALPILPPLTNATLAAVNSKKGVRHLFESDAHDIRLIPLDATCCSLQIAGLPAVCCPASLSQEWMPDERVASGDGVTAGYEIVGRSETLDAAISIAHQTSHLADQPETGAKTHDARIGALVQLTEMRRHSEASNSLESATILELIDRLQVGANWQHLQQYDQRAGIRAIDLDGWQPESPRQRIRRSMMGQSSAAYCLSDDRKLVFEINQERATRFQIGLRQPSLGFLLHRPGTAVIEARSQSRVVSLLQSDEMVLTELEIAGGRRRLTIQQLDRQPNQTILANLMEIDANGNCLPIDHGRVRRVADQRFYQVATAQTPLVIPTLGPVMIRVDQFRNGQTTSRTIAAQSDRVLRLVPDPDDGETQALFRVFVMQFDEPIQPSMISPAEGGQMDGKVDASDWLAGQRHFDDELHPIAGTISRFGVGYAAHPLSINTAANSKTADWSDAVVQALYEDLDQPERLAALDALALRNPDQLPLTLRIKDWAKPRDHLTGTTGLGIRYRSRFAEQEFPQPANSDEFVEFKVSRFNEDRWSPWHTQNDLLLRTRQSGAGTLGWDHRGTRLLPGSGNDGLFSGDRWGPSRWDYRGYLLAQVNLASRGDSDRESLWSTGFDSSLSQAFHWSADWSSRWEATVFGRSVKAGASKEFVDDLDQDIFTRYKADHPWGLRLSKRLMFQHNADSRWWVTPSVVSNSDQWTPDYAALHVGTDQLVGPLQLRVSYRSTEFFADNDRGQSRSQNVVYFDLRCNHWHGQDRRSEWGLAIRRDLTNENTTLGVHYIHYFNEGRGLRDFRPGSLLFQRPREERWTRQFFATP